MFRIEGAQIIALRGVLVDRRTSSVGNRDATQGIEAVHMIRKGRARWVGKGDALAQPQFIDELFGLTI
jgi:hypothetical protein